LLYIEWEVDIFAARLKRTAREYGLFGQKEARKEAGLSEDQIESW
jgi:hypothetical protein